MKKIVIVLAVLIFAAAILSGCCLSHEWADATCTNPKICTKCEETEGEALGHTWEAATCEAPSTCPVCDETQGEALGHSWQPATCTEAEVCSVCRKAGKNPLGHTLGYGKLTVDAGTGEILHRGDCRVCEEKDCSNSYSDWENLARKWTVGQWEFVECINLVHSDHYIPEEMAGDSFLFREDGTAEFVFEGTKDSGTWRYLDAPDTVLGYIVWCCFESDDGKLCQFNFQGPNMIGWRNSDNTIVMTYQKISD